MLVFYLFYSYLSITLVSKVKTIAAKKIQFKNIHMYVSKHVGNISLLLPNTWRNVNKEAKMYKTTSSEDTRAGKRLLF